MTVETIYAMRKLIKSGQRSFPIFIGFLNADKVKRLADAPAFARDTPHSDLAKNILDPPVRSWQRPLDSERVERIKAVFDDTGEFMPNPVLLAENAFTSDQIQVKQHTTASGENTMVWEISIRIPGDADAKPLWILDGQHRINGLAKSKQCANEIPFVLLFNGDLGNYYRPSDLAKVFAQVTTSAEDLDPLHNEWLTYAFSLGSYSDHAPDQVDRKKAMQSVAELCHVQVESGGIANPFFSEVQFNHFLPHVKPAPGGFGYKCNELMELIVRNYYRQSAMAGHLAPRELAEQLVRSHDGLRRVVQEPIDKNVFFGKEEFNQKIMQDAFLIGVLTYLLKNGPCSDWVEVLKTLCFHETSWEFTWTKSLHGTAQSNSKKLANNVLASVFREGSLPAGSNTLADFLRGNKAYVQVRCYELTPTGKKSTKDPLEVKYDRGSTETLSVGSRRIVAIESWSDNVVKVEVSDKNSPPGKLVKYDEMTKKKGLRLDESAHKKPLELLITLHHYGDVHSTIEVDVKW